MVRWPKSATADAASARVAAMLGGGPVVAEPVAGDGIATHAGVPSRSMADANLYLYLGLFLILLAFFILLSSISEVDARKARDVMQSVNQAFAPGWGIAADGSDSEPTPELANAAEANFNHLTKLFSAALPGLTVSRLNAGNALQIDVATDALFAAQGPDGPRTVRPSVIPLLSRVAATVARPAGAIHLAANVRMADQPGATSRIVADSGLLARALLAAGAPAGRLAIVLDSETGDEMVRFVFHAVPSDAATDAATQ